MIDADGNGSIMTGTDEGNQSAPTRSMNMVDATPIGGRIIEMLYVETMLLADDVRWYFDNAQRTGPEGLDMMGRVSFGMESLRATTRIMHVIAWLLARRAVQKGEIDGHEAMEDRYRLAHVPASDMDAIAGLPEEARILIMATVDIHERASRLQASIEADFLDESPARDILRRLSENIMQRR